MLTYSLLAVLPYLLIRIYVAGYLGTRVSRMRTRHIGKSMMDVHNCRGACVALEGNRNCPQLIDPNYQTTSDVHHSGCGRLTRRTRPPDPHSTKQGRHRALRLSAGQDGLLQGCGRACVEAGFAGSPGRRGTGPASPTEIWFFSTQHD